MDIKSFYTLRLLAQYPVSAYDIERFLESLSWLLGSSSLSIVGKEVNRN
jgi:hypothetical protein